MKLWHALSWHLNIFESTLVINGLDHADRILKISVHKVFDLPANAHV